MWTALSRERPVKKYMVFALVKGSLGEDEVVGFTG